jgi:hypothetical protein
MRSIIIHSRTPKEERSPLSPNLSDRPPSLPNRSKELINYVPNARLSTVTHVYGEQRIESDLDRRHPDQARCRRQRNASTDNCPQALGTERKNQLLIESNTHRRVKIPPSLPKERMFIR